MITEVDFQLADMFYRDFSNIIGMKQDTVSDDRPGPDGGQFDHKEYIMKVVYLLWKTLSKYSYLILHRTNRPAQPCESS